MKILEEWNENKKKRWYDCEEKEKSPMKVEREKSPQRITNSRLESSQIIRQSSNKSNILNKSNNANKSTILNKSINLNNKSNIMNKSMNVNNRERSGNKGIHHNSTKQQEILKKLTTPVQ